MPDVGRRESTDYQVPRQIMVGEVDEGCTKYGNIWGKME